MIETARLAERYDCQLHTHLCETEDEERFCLRRVRRAAGRSARGDRLDESRAPGSPTAFISTPRRSRRLGAAGVGVCHCAASNMVLASGICPTKELEAAGAPVGLGVDGSASNDSSNMMEAVRHALMIGRLRYGASAVTHLDVLRWATRRLGALPRPRRHRPHRRRAARPISRCSRSTSRASPARTIRSRRSCCAAPIAPTA